MTDHHFANSVYRQRITGSDWFSTDFIETSNLIDRFNLSSGQAYEFNSFVNAYRDAFRQPLSSYPYVAGPPGYFSVRQQYPEFFDEPQAFAVHVGEGDSNRDMRPSHLAARVLRARRLR